MTQNFQNHRRFVPLYHFVLAPLVIGNFLHAARVLLPLTQQSFWQMVVATALLLAAWFIRQFPVAVQDRVIRLEERLRLARLAPELTAPAESLTPGQWAALRFASDAEMPALAAEVLAGRLVQPDAIKRAVKSWRADSLRA
jgi:hypothetical protein